MAVIGEDLERLETMLGDLEGSVASAEAMTGSFRAEMEKASGTLKSASRDAAGLSRSLSGGLRSAFDDLIFDGDRLSDVLGKLGMRLADTVLDKALKPVSDGLGSLLGGAVSSLLGGAFAKGAGFSGGRVMPFANGGVVNGPTLFPMRGTMGLMGEAGPEAILPLARGQDGALGVRTAGGGGGVSVTMHVTTPDAESFARSRGQVAAKLSRAMGRGRKYL